MPDPWAPEYEKFKQAFEKNPVSEHTILVGHSCGCAFLVRWLGESKQKIDTLILVAPWKVPKAGWTKMLENKIEARKQKRTRSS